MNQGLFHEVRNAIRILSERVRKLEVLSFRNTNGWIASVDPWVYVGASSFKIEGKDVTTTFTPGTKLSWNDGSAKHGYVLTATFSVDTTVTIGGDTLSGTAISEEKYSYSTCPSGYTNRVSSTFVPLTVPLTSTSWDGDSYSTIAPTTIDLSSVFGVPAGVKAVLVRVTIRDSGSATNDVSVSLGPAGLTGALTVRCSGLPNDSYTNGCLTVPCDTNGDIHYTVTASGANTMDVTLQIWGYWL